ncbi:MAG: RNA methyltransferase [Planctomycetota bacterium]
MHPADDVIRSRANAALKRVALVARGKEDGVVLLEGERLVRDALRAGLRPDLVLVRDDRADLAADLGLAGARLVAAPLFERLGTLATPPGVLGLFDRPEPRDLDDLAARLAAEGPALLLGIAGVAEPGNLGALARSAEAAGADGVVVVEGGARPFTPKALRGSMGSLLRLSVFEVDDVAAVDAAATLHGVRRTAAATRGGTPLDEHDFGERAIVWVTGETGDAPPDLAGCDPVTIPMAGDVESLNVTVAGALLLFAAARQQRRT